MYQPSNMFCPQFSRCDVIGFPCPTDEGCSGLQLPGKLLLKIMWSFLRSPNSSFFQRPFINIRWLGVWSPLFGSCLFIHAAKFHSGSTAGGNSNHPSRRRRACRYSCGPWTPRSGSGPLCQPVSQSDMKLKLHGSKRWPSTGACGWDAEILLETTKHWTRTGLKMKYRNSRRCK